MVGAEMVVEVLDRPARMAGSVLLEHPFDPVGRHAARGRLVEPSVEQSVQAIVLVAAPVAAELRSLMMGPAQGMREEVQGLRPKTRRITVTDLARAAGVSRCARKPDGSQ